MDEGGNEPVPAGDTGRPAWRGSDGRFGGGNPGKPRGAKRKVTLAVEAIMEQAAGAMTERLVELAGQGEMAALRICMDRLAPPRRDPLVEFDLPPVDTAEDARRASSAILAAIAAGELSPAEGHSLIAMLVSHKGIVETVDLERRLAALEAETRP